MASSPDTERLRELMIAAGVLNGSGPAPAPPRERIHFTLAAPPAPREPKESRFTEVAFEEDDGAPFQSSKSSVFQVPPIAETDETLLALVFGQAAAGLAMEERLTRFVQWLMGSTGAFGAFVADADGLALCARNVPESYVAVTAPLGTVQDGISSFVPAPVEGSTIVELHDHNVLHVIWARTSLGRVAVGLILAGPLDASTASRIRRLLHLSISSKGTTQ